MSDLQIESNNWLDIFYGLLVSPIKTLNILSNPSIYPHTLSAVFGSLIIVVICALVDSSSGLHASSFSELAANIIISSLADLFFWFVLALFLRLLAVLMKISVSTRACLIVTGWAFMPIIFKATAACFSNTTIFGDILSLLISIWFLTLELFAFDSLLKLGRLKTLGIILFLPPCLFIAYLISIGFASAFVMNGS